MNAPSEHRPPPPAASSDVAPPQEAPAPVAPPESALRAAALRPLNDGERAVIEALREIAFGEVEVTIHNARIVQITRSQKFRFQER